MTLRPGSLLSKYEILKILGSGGFSVVYLAIDNNTNKYIAVKEFFPENLATRQGSKIKPINRYIDDYNWVKEKFIEEARILVKFDNPNIIDIFQIYELDNAAYLIMEYVQGLTMKSWLKQIGGNANQAELDLILKPIINALSLIHKNHFLHRDISPDNIMLRNNLSPVLIDFGAAKEIINRRKGNSCAIIKDGLSPPEQYSTVSNNQGPWSDIYSLAATLYYSISGKFPLEATDRMIEDNLVSLKYNYSANYRPNFLKAIDWGLKLSPSERPQTVKEWENLINN